MSRIFRETRPVGPPIDVDSLFERSQPGYETSESTLASAPAPRVAGAIRRRDLAFAAVTLAVILSAIYMTSSRRALADFADVLDRIEGLRTVQYTRYSTKSGRPLRPADDATVYDPQAELPPVLHVKVLGKHRQRTEVPGAGYDLIDSEAGVFVTVHPDRKLVRRITTLVRIDPKTGRQSSERYRVPPVDFYSLLSVPLKDVRSIGRATVDERPAVGFRRTVKKRLKTWTTTYWVDPDTRLPIRIETSMRTTEPGIQQWDVVATGFVFDETLDESLFDATPPEGYEVIEGKVIVRP